MHSIVTTMLCSIIADFIDCKRAFATLTQDLNSRKSRALKITFHLHVDHSKEFGFRYFDVIIWAPTRAACLLTIDKWFIVRPEDLELDSMEGSRLKSDRQFDDSNSGYQLHSYGVDDWREKLQEIISSRQEEITHIQYESTFYEIIPVLNIDQVRFKSLINSQRKNSIKPV